MLLSVLFLKFFWIAQQFLSCCVFFYLFLNRLALTAFPCLLCIRGRSAGEDLRRKKHAGAGPRHDQTDAAQAGAAERPQLAAGWYEKRRVCFYASAWSVL